MKADIKLAGDCIKQRLPKHTGANIIPTIYRTNNYLSKYSTKKHQI
jgi:hypothetical protein